MCECGCVGNDKLYTFPGPGKTYYLLALSSGCVDCDYPSGVSIEHLKPGLWKHKYYLDKEHSNGPLSFEEWPDSMGVAITTGMTRSDFVRATQNHLIGVSSDNFGDKGKIDLDGAEVIVEEMYEDSQTTPTIVKDSL